MRILGLNAYHGDSSACLVVDGELVAAAEEERFRRLKHWAGFPSMAIKYCLDEGGCRLSDVDHIAVNSNPRVHLGRKAMYALLRLPAPGLLLDRVRNQRNRLSIADELENGFGGSPFKGDIHRVEHHVSHLASAFLVSPYRDAVAVSIDGFGDFSSAAWGVGHDSTLRVDGRVYFPHSLGVFYQALTQYLGFPHYGDEYKVMGLAPYGALEYLPKMRQIVKLLDDGSYALDLTYFRHHREKIDYAWTGGEPSVGTLYGPALEELLGPARKPSEPLTQKHFDIAHSVQAMYEEACFHLLNTLHPRYGLDALTLAGGCAMNSVANGKVRRMTPFRRVYVQAAAGDAGGAIGAAMHVWHSESSVGSAKVVANGASSAARSPEANSNGAARSFVMNHAYFGPSFGNDAIASLLETRADVIGGEGFSVQQFSSEQELCNFTARSIADGQVIGWFQGRMEWGPRALGNRSIICDPRRADMKDILNLKIKRRESFRPFAPSILRECVSDWFEEDDDVPFMMQVYQIRPDMRPLIPAVTHVDGSGRLQTVSIQSNPLYHKLISAFQDLTGVPIVLNTSFNENEPVVCRPEEALDCFVRTKMDLLVLGNWSIQRPRRQ